MADRVTPDLLGQLLDEQGAALSLYAAQWTDAADDCVQEALIELARQTPVPASPVAWLYRVVRNRALSRSQSARRRERHESLAGRLRPQFTEDETADRELRAEEIAAAVGLLAEELREVVIARTWGQLGFEQIAALVGCSTSTAHRRYLMGLAALREKLEEPCQENTRARTN
jgi:RNA polymerase sigma factor (sigma-70 family)